MELIFIIAVPLIITFIIYTQESQIKKCKEQSQNAIKNNQTTIRVKYDIPEINELMSKNGYEVISSSNREVIYRKTNTSQK